MFLIGEYLLYVVTKRNADEQQKRSHRPSFIEPLLLLGTWFTWFGIRRIIFGIIFMAVLGGLGFVMDQYFLIFPVLTVIGVVGGIIIGHLISSTSKIE